MKVYMKRTPQVFALLIDPVPVESRYYSFFLFCNKNQEWTERNVNELPVGISVKYFEAITRMFGMLGKNVSYYNGEIDLYWNKRFR